MSPHKILLVAAIMATSIAAAAVVHPNIGDVTTSTDGKVKITFAARIQNFSSAMADSYDTDIHSPKSANITPDGKKYYINSLEGRVTIAYDMATNKKLKVIHHDFTDEGSKHLWAPASGLFKWHRQWNTPNTFMGKPVEAAFSHNGRYLWVPYFRRTFDLNAIEPSAMAVIDTRTDTIIRLFETGPLPKMLATSHDSKTLAVTHWGDNTVGLIDISSNNPSDWHYTKLLVVDYILPLDKFGTGKKINRNNHSGYCLRGTAFTPDDKYIIICCMGGAGGLAVIDVKNQKYLGRITGMMSNVRHILIRDGYIYLSINAAGYVQRIRFDDFMKVALNLTDQKGHIANWEKCKVGAGARTIEFSPSGKYIFAACNDASCVSVIDTRTMQKIADVPADSYPVGLDVSNDGKTVIITSQEHTTNGHDYGGQAVDIFHIDYAEPEPVIAPPKAEEQADSTAAASLQGGGSQQSALTQWLSTTTGKVTAGAIAGVLIAVIAVLVSMRRKKK